MDAVIEEFERGTALVLAAEVWPEGYKKSPAEYARMLRVESRLERLMLQHFKELATKVDQFINWNEYLRRLSLVQAADDFTVDVIVEDVLDELDENPLMQLLYNPLVSATQLGAQSAEDLYRVNLGVTESTEFVQRAAKEQIAELVGKKVDKKGVIRPNPNADYHINSKTKAEIRQSINTSLSLHEDITQTRFRIQKTIKNSKRAELIAQTETVNAYNSGILGFGENSGAVGKEWQDSGAVDICRVFADQGIVPLNHKYKDPQTGRSVLKPTIHPRDRCFLRLVYPEELED